MSKLGDFPAFPLIDSFNQTDDCSESLYGMTYRQWLVGMALQGFASTESARDTQFNDMAHWAVQAADSALAELEKHP